MRQRQALAPVFPASPSEPSLGSANGGLAAHPRFASATRSLRRRSGSTPWNCRRDELLSLRPQLSTLNI